MTTVLPDLRSSRADARRVPGCLLAISVLSLALAGCNTHGGPQVRGWVIADPSSRHPIHVEKREAQLEISVPRGADGLTSRQAADTQSFVHDFKTSGEGRLIVRAPSGSPNEVAAMRAVDDMRRLMRKAGLRSRTASFEPYFADGDPYAPIRMSYARVVAVPPECGLWPENLARDPRNLPYGNFGCASQRNLALMVADPRDLLGSTTMTPRSSERRDVVWDKYIKGETTITERSEEESAKVSEVSGGGE